VPIITSSASLSNPNWTQRRASALRDERAEATVPRPNARSRTPIVRTMNATVPDGGSPSFGRTTSRGATIIAIPTSARSTPIARGPALSTSAVVGTSFIVVRQSFVATFRLRHSGRYRSSTP
jgi:hypothetical protein